MKVRITQLDGRLPNLALMRLSAWHKAQGDEVWFRRTAEPDLLEPEYDRVYGSAIFEFSRKRLAVFNEAYPEAIVGGTGTLSKVTVEDLFDAPDSYDYTIYPTFTGSLGFTQRGCRLKCPFCVAPGSLIITGDGLRPIEEVRVGDMVLTHVGKYRRVVKTMCRYYRGSVVTLKSGALSELFPTTVTADHKVWTRHVSYYSGGQQLTLFNWLEADKVQAGYPHRARDHYAYPRTADTRARLEVPGVADWSEFDRSGGPPVKYTIDSLEVGAPLMTLLGFYISEGHLSGAGRSEVNSVVFSFGHTETEVGYAESVRYAAETFGLKAVIRQVPTGTRVSIYSTRFSRWLMSEFGTGSASKKIPLWVRQLPVPLLKQLLDVWCRGDGWEYIRKGLHTWRICTVSADLAVACRELALKCGYSATINRHKPSKFIQGREVNAQPAYTISFHEKPPTKHSVIADLQYVYYIAKQSETKPYAGFVYNLEVEEFHSYCTPAFAISNCVVPQKEGKNRSVHSINEIWRGEPWPKHLHLLDNDFFGQEFWRERAAEIIDGGFRVCFNQGINTRLINEESAQWLARMQYYDDQFKVRRIYTAYDNLKDFKIFFRGVDYLEKAGINPKDILCYMLIGYAKGETMEQIQWRFDRIRERGIFPFPMVYDRTRRDLRDFARWAIRGLFFSCSFEEYRTAVKKRDENEGDLFEDAAD